MSSIAAIGRAQNPEAVTRSLPPINSAPGAEIPPETDPVDTFASSGDDPTDPPIDLSQYRIPAGQGDPTQPPIDVSGLQITPAQRDAMRPPYTIPPTVDTLA
jgi:hypothetical protein